MAAPAFHESLPYIDTPSESSLAAARALIAQEAQTRPRAEPPAPEETQTETSLSAAMQTELARVASSTALTPLDTSRYEAQDLPPAAAGETETCAPVVGRAYTSAAYLGARLQNLQLLERHGANAWLLANYHLEATLRRVEDELARARRDVDEVNAARQRRQADVAAEMAGLEDTWRTGVGRVLETEVAVQELKALIREELRRKAGEAVA